MKKLRNIAICLSIALMTVAGYGDLTMKFSSRGIDCYSDGSIVKDGECYALVWVKGGAAFEGFQRDGNLVNGENNRLLIAAPVAKNGRCPSVLFQLDASLVPGNEGHVQVCLLDTRRADGTLAGLTEKGALTQVYGWGLVESAHVKCRETQVGCAESFAPTSSAVATTQSGAMPKDTPRPRIKGINVKNGMVYITVERTVNYLRYRAAAAETPDGVAAKSAVAADMQDGDATRDVVLILPQTGNSGFYGVKGF